MPQKQILIIGYTWPEPTTTAAGVRMMQLIHFFQSQEYAITFASTAAQTDFSVDLEGLGIQTQNIRLNDASFDAFVTQLKPEMVLFDRFLTEEQFSWRVAEAVPDALRILDTEDLHSLRTVREQGVKGDQGFTTTKWLQSDMTKREVASIFRSDLSLIISTYEMELLTQVVKLDKELLLYLPFQLDTIGDDHRAHWPEFEVRKDFCCIGNGKHAPNVDAILWLKKEIWPMIRKALPEAKLHIYGSYLPEHIRQMHNPKDGFYVEGWSESVTEVMEQSRVNLAPLRFGAGIKGKLIDAMQCGTPSITTTIGAESMQGALPWSGAIADDVQGFVLAAAALYMNQTKWQQAQQNGVDIINTLYDKSKLNQKLVVKIQFLQENLINHREANFLGSLLQHQTLASTKYLSKWIEEKKRRGGRGLHLPT